jgi:hypothetical protein
MFVWATHLTALSTRPEYLKASKTGLFRNRLCPSDAWRIRQSQEITTGRKSKLAISCFVAPTFLAQDLGCRDPTFSNRVTG